MTTQIRVKVAKLIYQLWGENLPNKAVLAALRGSKNVSDRKATNVWPMLLSILDRKDLSIDGQPTYAEKALYAALRCYALYQQGNDNVLVYAPAGENNGKNFFYAIAQLRQNDEDQVAIDRRVQAILANSNFESVLNNIYHLVPILKAKNNHELIDFAQLGQDLYYFQFDSENARQVSLKWGQQYYNAPQTINEKED